MDTRCTRYERGEVQEAVQKDGIGGGNRGNVTGQRDAVKCGKISGVLQFKLGREIEGFAYTMIGRPVSIL
jgi:hypothetical protein